MCIIVCDVWCTYVLPVIRVFHPLTCVTYVCDWTELCVMHCILHCCNLPSLLPYSSFSQLPFSGGNDYSAFQEIAVPLNLEGGQKETCFNVSIVDDSVHEADEVIGLRLAPGVEVSGSFILRNTRTSIVVRDDDSEIYHIYAKLRVTNM